MSLCRIGGGREKSELPLSLPQTRLKDLMYGICCVTVHEVLHQVTATSGNVKAVILKHLHSEGECKMVSKMPSQRQIYVGWVKSSNNMCGTCRKVLFHYKPSLHATSVISCHMRKPGQNLCEFTHTISRLILVHMALDHTSVCITSTTLQNCFPWRDSFTFRTRSKPQELMSRL